MSEQRHFAVVVEPDLAMRRKLTDSLSASSLFDGVLEVDSLAHAFIEVDNGSAEFCVLGPSVSEKAATEFVRRTRSSHISPECSFLAIRDGEELQAIPLDEVDTLNGQSSRSGNFTRLVERAIKNQPLAPEPLASPTDSPYEKISVKTSRRSQTARFRPRLIVPGREGFTLDRNLDRLAQELRRFGEKLKEEEGNFAPTGNPSPKLLRELRSSLENGLPADINNGLNGKNEQLLLEALVEWFIARASSERRTEAVTLFREKLKSA